MEVKDLVGKGKFKLKALGKGIKVGKVCGKRLLVKPFAHYTKMDEVEKAGLLVIPEAIKESHQPLPNTGIVVALGEGLFECEKDPVEENMDRDGDPIIKEGTLVFFSKFAGVDMVVDEEDLKIIDISEVICTLADVDDVIYAIKEEEDA